MRAGMRYQPQGLARVDPRFGATFAWVASAPSLDLVSGKMQPPLGVVAVNSQGRYQDLTGNAATQSFATPLPQAKYTIITVFVPRASVAATTLVRTTTNGFRVEVSTTAGGVNPYQVTNNAIANGPGLVTSTTFDGGTWVGITTYDGITMRSWIKKLGSTEFQTGSVAMGYVAPSGTLDIGGQQGIQAVVMTPNALPDSVVLDLLSNPWQLFQAPEEEFEVSAGTTYNVSIAETASAVDALSAILAGLVSIAETSTASDASSAALIGTAAVAEAGTAADSQAASAVFVATRSDVLAAADTTSTGGAITSAAVAETGAATDSTSAIAAFLASVAEIGTALDSQNATAVLSAAWSDALNAADSQNWGGSVISVSLSEALNALDSQSASTVFAASVSESSAALDSTSCVLIANASISEVLAALDSSSVQLITSASIAEALSAMDTTSIANLNFIAAASHILVGRERVTVLVGKSRVLVIY